MEDKKKSNVFTLIVKFILLFVVVTYVGTITFKIIDKILAFLHSIPWWLASPLVWAIIFILIIVKK